MYSEWVFKPNEPAVCKNCGVSISPHSKTTPYCAYCGCRMINYTPSKCSCYMLVNEKPECWGTRERDPCSCGGDKRKCDFYEEVRNKALSMEEK